MVGKRLFSWSKKDSYQPYSHQKKEVARLPKANKQLKVTGNKGYIQTKSNCTEQELNKQKNHFY
jgi:hypothetical protein